MTRSPDTGKHRPPTPLPHGSPAEPRQGRTWLYVLLLLLFLGGVVHPVRHWLVEPRRQALLGNHEPAARRLALASQFGFTTAAGSAVRLVPGQPQVELRDLPAQAVTLVLGGFRGPYVIWLWYNVEEEKQKRIHFDLIERYTQIAALQSDYPAMWVYHIWNMGWNVSIQWQSPDMKYKWIRRAVEFGAEGYRRNPHNAEIMAEIGRVYSEKLGRSQEAAYYRKRVKEDEGRSTYLIAYEWYDRARRANDREQTLLHGLTKVAVYSQAPHNLSYFATETTLEGDGLLMQSVDLRRAGREAAAREAFARGLAAIREAAPEWEWARREWREHAVRFEKEGAPASLNEIYRRFYNEADSAVRELGAFQAEVTYDKVPLYCAARQTDVAFAALEESAHYAAQPPTERAGRDAYARGIAAWDEAVQEWERALTAWDEHLAAMPRNGASADALAAAKDLRGKTADYLAYLKATRQALTPATLADLLKAARRPPVAWPMPDLSL